MNSPFVFAAGAVVALALDAWLGSLMAVQQRSPPAAQQQAQQAASQEASHDKPKPTVTRPAAESPLPCSACHLPPHLNHSNQT